MKFESLDKLKELIKAYFDERELNKLPYTVTGLAIALGTSRKVLCEYAERDGYSNTIMLAKAKCEEFAESQLFIGRNPSGAQFALANNYEGWKNKSENKTTIDGNLTLGGILTELDGRTASIPGDQE